MFCRQLLDANFRLRPLLHLHRNCRVGGMNFRFAYRVAELQGCLNSEL
ncbi:hypothetical protein V3C99_013839 [Haemonchus contortus]|uniref:Protein F09G8.5 n=1 Tax=Haemonchus contortus TaxID=6289 RepID=A0A7I4YR66_HAECO